METDKILDYTDYDKKPKFTFKTLLKYLLFIPLSIITITLIFTGLLFLLQFLLVGVVWLNQKLNFIIFGIVMGLGGILIIVSIYSLFKRICLFLILLIKPISPSLYFAFYFLSIIIILNMVLDIRSVWLGSDDYNGFIIFLDIIGTLIILGFAGSAIKISGVIPESERWKYKKES